MPILLSTSRRFPSEEDFDYWIPVAGTSADLNPDRRRVVSPREFESAVDAIRDQWIDLARYLAAENRSAELAHAATCNTNVSDLGVMLAWLRIIDNLNQDSHRTLIVCDDPWLFRHLVGLGYPVTGPSPRLWWVALRLKARGVAARTLYAVRTIMATHKAGRQAPVTDQPAILVYGHPTSNAKGHDAYFGDLMQWLPALRRVMHVDCDIERSNELAVDGRTESLHGFGNVSYAVTLPWRRWRPSHSLRSHPLRWLIYRAASQEGSTGQGAAIAWQRHCQKRWLARAKPSHVAWPWENHGWERGLARSARALGIRTLGYQHTVVGRRHWVHAFSNADGIDSLPDHIACNGITWIDVLSAYGIPHDRQLVAGALRFKQQKPLKRDPQGPIFVALPFAHDIAGPMMDAIQTVAHRGRFQFAISTHPMNPYPFEQTKNIYPAKCALSEIASAAVLYAATTVGLEGYIGGLPVVRFVPPETGSVDVIPESAQIHSATSDDLGDVLAEAVAAKTSPIDATAFFATPDPERWRVLLGNAD